MCYAAESPPRVAWVQDKIPLHAHAICKDHTDHKATRTLCGRTPPTGHPWRLTSTFPIGTICTMCRWSYSARTGFDIQYAIQEDL